MVTPEPRKRTCRRVKQVARGRSQWVDDEVADECKRRAKAATGVVYINNGTTRLGLATFVELPKEVAQNIGLGDARILMTAMHIWGAPPAHKQKANAELATVAFNLNTPQAMWAKCKPMSGFAGYEGDAMDYCFVAVECLSGDLPAPVKYDPEAKAGAGGMFSMWHYSDRGLQYSMETFERVSGHIIDHQNLSLIHI